MIKLILHLFSVMKKDDFQSERFQQITKEIKPTWSFPLLLPPIMWREWISVIRALQDTLGICYVPKRMKNMHSPEIPEEFRTDFLLEQGIAIMPMTTLELTEGMPPICFSVPVKICFTELYKYTNETKRTGQNHLGMGQERNLQDVAGQELNGYCEDSVPIGRDPCMHLNNLMQTGRSLKCFMYWIYSCEY